MYVNTTVVRALMELRGVSLAALASLCHVKLSTMARWLNDDSDAAAEGVPFESQLEALRILGVDGEQPRADVVHYWRIHEKLFSRGQRNYWALQTLLRTFGKAQACFISRESDPSMSFEARAHFGLRFEHFLAIVEVTAHPLRNISFGPAILSDLEWMPEAMGVLLPNKEYDELEPGAMNTRGLNQYLTYTTEAAQWDRLRDKALEQGIRAEQVASLLLGNTGPLQVSHEEVPAAAAAAREPSPGPTAEALPPAAQATAASEAPAPATNGTEGGGLFVTAVRPGITGAESSRLKRVV